MNQNNKLESISIVGIPFDEYSSFSRGPAKAPKKILDALNSGSSNMCTEDIIDLGKCNNISYLENLEVTDYMSIENQVTKILEKKTRLISLGGDHSITYPVVKAFNKYYKNLNILQFDAHADLYNEYQGNPYSHACPFARIMEQDLAENLFQVGIRTMTKHLKEQSEKFNTRIYDMKSWRMNSSFNFTGPVYISLDLDVLDPAFAPGISHYEPGGFSTRDLIQIIQNLKCEVVGADIVELNPKYDFQNITAMAAAKLLKEIISVMLKN